MIVGVRFTNFRPPIRKFFIFPNHYLDHGHHYTTDFHLNFDIILKDSIARNYRHGGL